MSLRRKQQHPTVEASGWAASNDGGEGNSPLPLSPQVERHQQGLRPRTNSEPLVLAGDDDDDYGEGGAGVGGAGTDDDPASPCRSGGDGGAVSGEAHVEAVRQAQNAFRLEFAEFQEQPRQVLLISAIVGVMALTFWDTEPAMGPRVGAKRGVCAVMLTLCTITYLQSKDCTAIVRPHPAFWRMYYGLAVFYFLLLVALFVQSYDHALLVIQVFFPEAGSKGGQSMGLEHLDCAITPKSVWGQLTSIWFLAHLVGWWGKMCMFRSWGYCWALALIFETMELTLQFVIPEFQECWWDSVLIDLFGANLLGMWLGKKTLDYLETRDFQWEGKGTLMAQLHERKTLRGKLSRLAAQFTPYKWSGRYKWVGQRHHTLMRQRYKLSGQAVAKEEAAQPAESAKPRKAQRRNSAQWRKAYLEGPAPHWDMFASPANLLVACSPLLIDLVMELNAFFILNVFQIPKESSFNRDRLIFFFILALPALGEYYAWMSSPGPTRMGHFSIIIISSVFLETLVWLKFAPPQLLRRDIPEWIAYPWVAMLGLQVLWCTFFFLLRRRLPARLLGALPVGFTLVTYFLTFTPLLFLTRGWAF